MDLTHYFWLFTPAGHSSCGFFFLDRTSKELQNDIISIVDMVSLLQRKHTEIGRSDI